MAVAGFYPIARGTAARWTLPEDHGMVYDDLLAMEVNVAAALFMAASEEAVSRASSAQNSSGNE